MFCERFQPSASDVELIVPDFNLFLSLNVLTNILVKVDVAALYTVASVKRGFREFSRLIFVQSSFFFLLGTGQWT